MKRLQHFLQLNESGFTVMEAVIALGLASVVVIGAGEGLVMISGGASKMMIRTTSDANSKSFNQTFTSIIESAYMASQFQHAPISVICPESGDDRLPCVRKFDSTTGTFVKEGASSITQQFIEFYRDDDPGTPSVSGGVGTGLYNSQPAWGSASGAKVQGTSPLNLTDEQRSGNLFATWPLVDEASPPFVMLRSSGTHFYFKLDPNTAALSTSKTHSFFKATAKLSQEQIDSLKGSLMLVYNSLSPNQYAVQYVSEIVECIPESMTDSSPCEKHIYWAQPPAFPDIVASWKEAAEARTDVEYALELKPLTVAAEEGHVRGFASFYQPTLASLGVSFNRNWGPVSQQQDSRLYSFPTRTFSLHDATNPVDFPVAHDTVFDVRRMQHYYDTISTTIGNASTVTVGIPVMVTAYYLKINSSATSQAQVAAIKRGKTPPSVYSLYTSTYSSLNDNAPVAGSRSGDTEFALLDQVTDRIVFARAIGSNALSLVVYHSGATVSMIDLQTGKEIPVGSPKTLGLWLSPPKLAQH